MIKVNEKYAEIKSALLMVYNAMSDVSMCVNNTVVIKDNMDGIYKEAIDMFLVAVAQDNVFLLKQVIEDVHYYFNYEYLNNYDFIAMHGTEVLKELRVFFKKFNLKLNIK